MGSDGRLNGREERRLPIMMEVGLAPRGRASGERCERTFTDNISPHGIRVQSTSAWRRGEQADVTPMKGEIAMLGEVVYCQKVRNDRYLGASGDGRTCRRKNRVNAPADRRADFHRLFMAVAKFGDNATLMDGGARSVSVNDVAAKGGDQVRGLQKRNDLFPTGSVAEANKR